MARSLKFHEDNSSKYIFNHCNDPICDSNRRKALQELDLAKLKIKQLQSENGFDKNDSKNMRTYSSLNCAPNELYKTRDLTRNKLTTNDPTLFTQRTSKPGAITEIETVL
jgi:hypothetical protein